MTKLIFKGFYRFLQVLFNTTLGLYYRKIVYINPQFLREEGPLLVISNHPNALMDPVFAVQRMYSICHLLANASLFKNPIISFILSNTFCIPVQRTTDVAEGQPIQNDDAFQKCDEHLMAGGKLYIAIEGFSYPERSVRPFKTGTARIAFNAEMKANFDLNLRVLPIGITYSDSQKFDSDVVVEIGQPISVDSWQEVYAKDSRKTIQDFTDFLESKVKELTVDCRDVAEDEFLKKIEAVAQSENLLETEATYRRSQSLLQEIHNWQKTDEKGYLNFKNQVESYFSKLNELKIKDLNAEKYNSITSLLKLITGLPLFIYGFINNIIPAWLSEKAIKILKVHEVYDTTVRYSAGVLFFPIFWSIQKRVIAYFCADIFEFTTPLKWMYYLTMIPIAVATWWFYKEWEKYFAYFTFKKADKNRELSRLRQPIVGGLNRLLKQEPAVLQV